MNRAAGDWGWPQSRRGSAPETTGLSIAESRISSGLIVDLLLSVVTSLPGPFRATSQCLDALPCVLLATGMVHGRASHRPQPFQSPAGSTVVPRPSPNQGCPDVTAPGERGQMPSVAAGAAASIRCARAETPVTRCARAEPPVTPTRHSMICDRRECIAAA